MTLKFNDKIKGQQQASKIGKSANNIWQ